MIQSGSLIKEHVKCTHHNSSNIDNGFSALDHVIPTAQQNLNEYNITLNIKNGTNNEYPRSTVAPKEMMNDSKAYKFLLFMTPILIIIRFQHC